MHDLRWLSFVNHVGIWSHFSDSMLWGHSEEECSALWIGFHAVSDLQTTNHFAHKPVAWSMSYLFYVFKFLSIKIYIHWHKCVAADLILCMLPTTSKTYLRFLELFWRINYCILQFFVLFDIQIYVNSRLRNQSRDIFGSQKSRHDFGWNKIETRAFSKGSFFIS